MNRAATIPNPMFSLEQYDEFHHADIEYLTDAELQTELYRRRAVIWERREPKRSWLHERVQRIEAELKRRWWEKKNSTARSTSTKLAAGVTL